MKEKIKNNNYKQFNYEEVNKGLNKNSKEFYSFKNDFPRLEDYTDINQLKEKFPHLKNINKPIKIDSENINNNIYIKIDCKDLEDIHKSIKYGIFNDEEIEINKKINKLLKSFKDSILKRKIFLIFFDIKNNSIISISKIKSLYNFEEEFFYWRKERNYKNNGYFDLKWKAILNIPIDLVKYKDDFYTLIELEHGKILKNDTVKEIIDNYNFLLKTKNYKTILSNFKNLDLDEDELRNQISNFNNNQNNYQNNNQHFNSGYEDKNNNYQNNDQNYNDNYYRNENRDYNYSNNYRKNKYIRHNKYKRNDNQVIYEKKNEENIYIKKDN